MEAERQLRLLWRQPLEVQEVGQQPPGVSPVQFQELAPELDLRPTEVALVVRELLGWVVLAVLAGLELQEAEEAELLVVLAVLAVALLALAVLDVVLLELPQVEVG